MTIGSTKGMEPSYAGAGQEAGVGGRSVSGLSWIK